MKATFEISRSQVDGKIYIELIVKNSMHNNDLDLILDNLGYKNFLGIKNRKSIVVTTPQELDAAREPILRFFRKEAINGVLEEI